MVAVFLAGGCAGMSTTQQRPVSGGAAIGGGAGLLGGYAYGRYEKSQGRL
jgi:hydrogenase/urease accessory protein HupE